MENQTKMETKKPLEILVIEDTPEFMEVAKSVYDNDTNIIPRYASTYEEAIKILKETEVQCVISDLFFPSQIDWKGKYAGEIEENRNSFVKEQRELLLTKYSEEEIKQAEEQVKQGLKPKNPFNFGSPRVQLSPAYDFIELIEQQIQRTSEYQGLQENPAGLGIASYCLKNQVPFGIISQGERHRGNLAIVRQAVQEVKEFRNVNNDFLPYVLFCSSDSNGEMDKRNPQIWRDAIYGEGSLFGPSRQKILKDMFDAYEQLEEKLAK
ncbi:MAG: hypothetical protein Q7J54_03040 [Candidatus Woesearchaeota archaeon]|nr:hypothetical protein [Candidatus Woesearchaeota archaeon]